MFFTQFLAISHPVFGIFSLGFWKFLIQYLAVSHSVFGSYSHSFWQFLTKFLEVYQSLFGSFSCSLRINMVTVGEQYNVNFTAHMEVSHLVFSLGFLLATVTV